MLFPNARKSPTRASLGRASLSISSRFVFRSGAKLDVPVTLPPGRAKLEIRPALTGSEEYIITMGMVVVALLAANAGPTVVTTIRSTLRRTRSAACRGRLSFLPSVNRYSMVIFFPSIHPCLRISCRNASRRIALPAAVPESRNPMRKLLPACCASTDPQSTKSMAQSAQRTNFSFSTNGVFLMPT